MNISPSPSNSLNQQYVGGKHADVNERTTSDEYESPQQQERRPLKKRILAVLWDTFDKSPEERKLIGKLDWWILTYCCIAYFVKYLDQTNVSGNPLFQMGIEGGLQLYRSAMPTSQE